MSVPGLYSLLERNLTENAGHAALIDAARQVDYFGLALEAGRIAAWLADAGVEPGDRVIVHLRKGIDEVAAMFGAWARGAVVVNVNAQWTAAQLAYVAVDSGARAVILSRQALPGLAAHPLPDTVRRVLVQGAPAALPPGADPWPQTGGQAPQPMTVDPSRLAMIIYTSGSTGQPKGVMLSHDNILIGAQSVIQYLGLDASDRLISVLPYSFDAGLNQLTTMMMTGGTVVHQPVTLPAEIIRMVRDHAVTGFAGVPPLWSQVVRLLDADPVALPALRRITNTGGKIAPDILDRLPHVFPGVDIYLMYGLTEAFRSTYLPPERFARKKGSIGQAIPNARVYVVKPGQGPAGPGEQGELVHAGPLVSLGYWQRPDLTAAKIRPCPELKSLIGDEPVVWSGDLVRVDEDGDLWFVGRMDDMIKTSGFRLSPTEVEDIVSNSGMAADVVAFGVEDDDLGQVVHVAVAPLPGCDAAALMAHCRKTMPHYMVPRRILPWPGAMPRTSSGKLDRPAVIAACRSPDKTPEERARP